MKFLMLLFSFYLLLLSVYPCNDMDDCATEQTQTISATTHQHKQFPETESCTPFCTCVHCPASVVLVSAQQLSGLPKAVISNHFYYQLSLNSYNEKSIWQPPQLS